MNIYGMPIVESVLAVTREGGKLLPFKSWHRRRGYAKRIQKKWERKYGPVICKPAAYEIRDPATGQRMLVVHPEIARQLRSATEGDRNENGSRNE